MPPFDEVRETELPGNVFQAAGRTVKLLREDIERVSAKVTEIKDELKTISQRITEIKTTLGEIEKKLPEKEKAKV
ncbi:MAG TPA: hypothetical protein VFE98_11475 [Candidatus Bathyarchaeia archaeon]|nr:hypothetical protein [Candidatus Bathyarchaeia archaeon]